MRKTLTTLLLVAGFAMSLLTSNTYAQSECKGSLIINEISNGPNGAKEWVELVAAKCGTCVGSTVDISRWVIDDNNGIFTSDPAAAGTGLGISAGHIRLSEDSLWQNFPVGTILVLFNGNNYDSTNADFVNADGVDFYNNGAGAIFVAVGGLGASTIVDQKTTPPSTSSIFYCPGDYQAESQFQWDRIGMRNAIEGDGIQTRCPGCNSAGEPAFYHGVSYGELTLHVSNPAFVDGAHIDLDTLDATARAFEFFQSLDPGVDSNWRFIPDSLSTPGAPNNAGDNTDFIALIGEQEITFNCCPEDTTIVTPPDTTATGPGTLIITEISNGPSGNCEYIEMIVAACGGADVDSVDIRGWIVDDNGGNFTAAGCASGQGISQGHLRFAAISEWEKVAVGTIIVLFNNGDNCFSFTEDLTDGNSDRVYFVGVGSAASNTYIERTNTSPASGNCDYCGVTYNSTTWATAVALSNSADAAQVRCPGDCDATPTAIEPSFYHGVSYGTGFLAIAPTANSIGGAKATGSGSGGKFEFFQNDNPALGVNWRRLSATTATTAGVVRTAFRDSVSANLYTFPCCTSGGEGAKFNNSLGVNEVAQGDVKFYPNPAGNELFISINAATEFEVKLVDLVGRVVYKQTYPATQGTSTISLDVTDLAEGMYIYTVTASGSEGVSGKLMIKK